LLVNTAEQYQQELECDRELFQVITLDASGVPRSCITAHQAANLLAEASEIAKKPMQEAKASPRKKPSTKRAAITLPIAPVQQQPSTAPHQASTKPALNQPSARTRPHTSGNANHHLTHNRRAKKMAAAQSRCGHFSINFSNDKFSNRQKKPT
jgi:hypothetical protein